MQDPTIEALEKDLTEIINTIDVNDYNFSFAKRFTRSEFVSNEVYTSFKMYLPLHNGEYCIEFRHRFQEDRLIISTSYTDSSDEDDDMFMEFQPIRFPRTEEEYFQYLTIQDNVFTLEFYQLLDKTMSDLLVKWQSLA